MDLRLDLFPGGDLVQAGLVDLRCGVESIPALLVSIGAERLRHAGLAVPRDRCSLRPSAVSTIVWQAKTPTARTPATTP